MKIVCRIILISITVLLMQNANGQTTVSPPKLPNVVPPTPDAQALGKFGDIPVGQFTGVPDISVPVYQINIGEFTLPISLRYHASGVKVEEISSSVGNGWALDAGGIINQSVNGRNDLEGEGYPTSQYRLPTHPFTNPITHDPNLSDGGYDYDYAKRVAEGTVDSQPDLFYYNFCGFSGKFYIDQDGQIHTIPFDPMKFEIPRYKITDKNGNIYIFGTSETSTSTDVCGVNVSGSIYLDKILLKNHDSIIFEYAPTTYTYKMISGIARAVPLPGQGSFGGQLLNLDCFGSGTPAVVQVAGVQLKRIVSSRGHVVEFNYDKVREDLTGCNALTSIGIKYKNSPIRTFSLYQSYFLSGFVSGPDDRRLKFDSIITGDQVYRFYYDETINLPNRLSFSQDHWGYYNGKSGNTTMLPADPLNGWIDGADREVDTNYVRAGILEQVVYPTGGFTQFDYEPNTYHFSGTKTNVSDQNEFVAGSPTNTVVKTFTIPGPPAQISNARAIVFANPLVPPGDLGSPGSDPICDIVISGENGYYNAWSNMNSPTSGFSLSLQPGNYTASVTTYGDYSGTYVNVQYQITTSQQVDENDFIGGLRVKRVSSFAGSNDPAPHIKVYKYDYPDTHFSSGQINFKPTYEAYRTYAIDFGNPAYVYSTYLRQSANSVFPLGTIHGGSVGYIYAEAWDGENAENGKTISYYSFLADGGGSSSYPLVPTVSRDWNSGFLLEEDTYKNNGTGAFLLLNKKNNFYSDHSESEYWNQHFAPGTYNSNDYLRGWGVSIIYSHPQGQAGLSQSPAEFFWNDYHFISRWVRLDSTVEKLYDPGNGADFLQTLTKHSYDNLYCLQPTKTSTYNSKNELVEHLISYPHDLLSGLSSSALAAKDELVNRWQIMRPLDEITKKNGNVISETRSNYSITPENNVLLSSVQTAVLNYPLETRLSFNKYDYNGNVIDMQKVGDMDMSYVWDYQNLYPIAEVKNASPTDIAYTSFEADGTGNWTFNGVAIDTTSSITGRKSGILSGSIYRSGLNSSNTYIVSYWLQTQSHSALNIPGTIAGYPITGRTVNLSNGSWTLFVHKVTGQSTIMVSGSGLIDELRLYPVTAHMTTYTYDPLIGTTSQNDINNKITYYEYDGIRRLMDIKDQDGNVIKTIDYHYKGQ